MQLLILFFKSCIYNLNSSFIFGCFRKNNTQALQANFIYLFSRIRAREACRNHRLQRDSQVIPLQSDLCFSNNTIHINYLFIKIDSI